MFCDSDIMSNLFPVGTLPSPPVTFVCLFLFTPFSFHYTTFSSACFFLPSPWPAKSHFFSNFMFSSSNPRSTFPNSSLLSQSPSFTLLPTSIHPASHLTFLSSPAWMADFSSLFFFPFDTQSAFLPHDFTLPPTSIITSSLVQYPSLLQLLWSYSRVYLCTSSIKDLVYEDLISFILSAFPQE